MQKHLVVPNPYAGSDEETLQQILQQKFSAQRRKDLLTLQSGQAPKVANEKEVQDQASAKIDPTDSSQSNTKLQAARSGRKRKTEVMQKQEAKRERKVARSQKANTKLARQLGKAITIQTSIEKTVRENPSNSDFVDPEPQEPEKSNNDDNILEIKELNGKKRKDVSVDLDQNKTSIEEIGRKNPSNSDFVDPEAKRKAKREAKRKAKRESKRERKVARSQKANIELAKPLGNAITIQTSIEKTVRKTSNSDFVDPEPQKPEKSNNDDTTLEIRELDGRKRKDVNVDLDQSKTSIEEIVRENPFNSDFVDPEPQKPEKSNNDETTLETREPDGKKGKDVSVDLDQGKASNLVKPTTTTPTSDNISNTQQSSREQSNSVTSPGGSRSEETSIEDFFRNASFGTSLDYKLATNSSRVRKVIRVPEVTIRKLESGLAPKIPLHNAESLGQLATETSNQGKVKAYKKVASVNDNNSPRALLKEHESAKTKHNATKFYNVPGFDSLKARLGQKSKKPSAGIEKANAADLQILRE